MVFSFPPSVGGLRPRNPPIGSYGAKVSPVETRLDRATPVARASGPSRTSPPMIEAVLPFPNIDPVLIHIYGPISIRWYALAYIAGLLLGWGYVLRLLRTPKLWAGPPFMGKPPATADDIGDLFVWVTLGVIIGGRLGFVLLYGVLYCGFAGQGAPACTGLPDAYLADPLKIVAAWEGGMSFHG